MALFRSIAEETRRFGTNSYLEVARKRLSDETGETEVLVVSRGFLREDGSKVWTRFVTVPDDPEVRAWLAEAVGRL